jgi:DNA gyrase subunit A
MGRATSGVTGMRFRDHDSLLAMSVIPRGEDPDVFVVFENGMAKRSPASDWNVKGRGILGVAVAKITERNGDLVGALTVHEDDEVLVIMGKGNIVRMKVDGVTRRSRNTQGMRFASPPKGDYIVAVARNPERVSDEDDAAEVVAAVTGQDLTDATAEIGETSDDAVTSADADAAGAAGAAGDSGAADAVPSEANEDSQDAPGGSE